MSEDKSEVLLKHVAPSKLQLKPLISSAIPNLPITARSGGARPKAESVGGAGSKRKRGAAGKEAGKEAGKAAPTKAPIKEAREPAPSLATACKCSPWRPSPHRHASSHLHSIRSSCPTSTECSRCPRSRCWAHRRSASRPITAPLRGPPWHACAHHDALFPHRTRRSCSSRDRAVRRRSRCARTSRVSPCLRSGTRGSAWCVRPTASRMDATTTRCSCRNPYMARTVTCGSDGRLRLAISKLPSGMTSTRTRIATSTVPSFTSPLGRPMESHIRQVM